MDGDGEGRDGGKQLQCALLTNAGKLGMEVFLLRFLGAHVV